MCVRVFVAKAKRERVEEREAYSGAIHDFFLMVMYKHFQILAWESRAKEQSNSHTHTTPTAFEAASNNTPTSTWESAIVCVCVYFDLNGIH